MAALMVQVLRGSPFHQCFLSSAVSHLPFWNIQALDVEAPWTESPCFLAVPPIFHLSVFIPLSGRFTSIFYFFFFFFKFSSIFYIFKSSFWFSNCFCFTASCSGLMITLSS